MIDAYVVSALDGRLRIRHPFLMDKDLAEAIFVFLKGQAMLDSVSVNPRTGSILIEYDSLKTTQKEIIADLEEYAMSYCVENGYLEELIKFEQNAGANNDDAAKSGILFNIAQAGCRRVINRSMIAFLVASMVSGFSHKTGGHLLTSGIFIALSLAHIYTYRKRI